MVKVLIEAMTPDLGMTADVTMEPFLTASVLGIAAVGIPFFVVVLASWALQNRAPVSDVPIHPSPPVLALHGFTARSGQVLRLLALQTPARDDAALGCGLSTKTAKRWG